MELGLNGKGVIVTGGSEHVLWSVAQTLPWMKSMSPVKLQATSPSVETPSVVSLAAGQLHRESAAPADTKVIPSGRS